MNAPALDPSFLTTPIAHRGLHDKAAGVIENSRAAVSAAAEAGYGIEIDVQLSADGEAMVFHDDRLMRVTGEAGRVRTRTARELGFIELTGGEETIPTLAEILAIVGGRVPILVETKDQHGGLGPVDGRLERRAARLLSAYPGPAALMSFNPHSVAICAEAAPDIARGRVTCAFRADDWPNVAHARRAELRPLRDLDALRCGFISHQHGDLHSNEVREVKEAGLPILCWTIRSRDDEATARRVADNVTFEGYAAATNPTDGA